MIAIPTISQLYSDIKADLEAEYGESITIIGRVMINALALVQAGKLKLFYLAIGSLQKNIFIDTAEPEATGGTLERFGRIKLGRNPFPATAGQYTCTVTGTTGGTIRAGTTFKSNDDSLSPGKLFIIDTEFTLSGSSGSITLRALEAGLDSQLEVGDLLTATEPIANVNKSASVTAELVEPLAAEDIEDYRQKALDSYRQEPQGGAATDYRLWAADAQGVEKVYPYAKSGAPNEINLYVEATLTDSTDGKGTPTTAILEAVEEVVEFDPDTTKDLNERGRRPLTVFEVHYLAVTIKEIDIEITGFVGITDDLKTSILSALTEQISRIRPFVAAADILESKNDILDVNRIIATILSVRPGSVFTSVVLKVDSSPLSTYTFENGNIPHLNSITYF